ncbi:hypothetical protein MXB_1644 [Myxobolus squamalis]|nr:hypothetical protein MXB_1644 [Myxobolus squamalis]
MQLVHILVHAQVGPLNIFSFQSSVGVKPTKNATYLFSLGMPDLVGNWRIKLLLS